MHREGSSPFPRSTYCNVKYQTANQKESITSPWNQPNIPIDFRL